ncbi:hypothetical protein DUI87_03677 [Hirundo rustica rustica]|uniref:ribonuclease H n=1 Tax=Hirundo rustica rustica TaxID=333673 RepID=A0A3M0L164_HIRRU|nr:hypothetical protein DUI87_03677 [Hirundo rustica rustica]
MMTGLVGSPVAAVMQDNFGCSVANRFYQLLDDESDPFDVLREAERRQQQRKKRDEAAPAARRAVPGGRGGGGKRETQKERKQPESSPAPAPAAPPPRPGPKRAPRQVEQQGFSNRGTEGKKDKTEWRPSFRDYRPYGAQRKVEFSMERPVERLDYERPIRGRGGGRGRMRGRGRGGGLNGSFDGFDQRRKREPERQSGNDETTAKMFWMVCVLSALADATVFVAVFPEGAASFTVKKEGAQEQVLEEMALINANEQSKAAILSLPMEPVPTLDDMLQIPLHPDDAPCFVFSVPTLNQEAPRKRYHWKFLPQGMKTLPSICQWYLSSLLSPVHAAVGEAIILHYMDDVLVCAPNDDLLSHVPDLTIDSLVAAGFELQEEQIQRMPPWKYLGLEIGKRTIVPQKLVVKNNIKTLADVQQLCGSFNWVRPWLGLTTEDLDPLFNLLKGEEELSSPRTLTQEARAALEKWERVEKSKKDKDCRDPLLIIEWVFFSHHWSRRMTRPQELVAELIRKARIRIRELAGCDFECIHIPIEINLGQITKAVLEHLLHENEALQFALDSYTGQISIHRPAHK